MGNQPMTNETAWAIYAHALETFGYAAFTGILLTIVVAVFTSATVGVAAGGIGFLATVAVRASGARRGG